MWGGTGWPLCLGCALSWMLQKILSWMEPEHYSSFLHRNTGLISIANGSPSKMLVELIGSISVGSVYPRWTHNTYGITQFNITDCSPAEIKSPSGANCVSPPLHYLPHPLGFGAKNNPTAGFTSAWGRASPLFNVTCHVSPHLRLGKFTCMARKCHMPHMYTPLSCHMHFVAHVKHLDLILKLCNQAGEGRSGNHFDNSF